MLSRAFRCQVRLSLSDVDRGVYVQEQISLAQQPDEPDEHILLRFLSYVFFYEEGLQDRDGWNLVAEPDLSATDLTGDVTLWIEVGPPQQLKRLVRALGRYKDARIVALFADVDEATTLRRELVAQRARNLDKLEILLATPRLMERLEAIGSRSMEWDATITDGLLYLSCDGEVIEGRLRTLDELLAEQA
ncbi:MAG: YaeQ family protein [Deltaproteobacteria bacterium]|nr:YaeQ family protein [Deltaproteobacteria bacterium]